MTADELRYHAVVTRALRAIESGRELAESSRQWRAQHTSALCAASPSSPDQVVTSADLQVSHRGRPCASRQTGSEQNGVEETACQPDTLESCTCSVLNASQAAPGHGQRCSCRQSKAVSPRLAAFGQPCYRVEGESVVSDILHLHSGEGQPASGQESIQPRCSTDDLLPAQTCSAAFWSKYGTAPASSVPDTQQGLTVRPAPGGQITAAAQHSPEPTPQLARVQALTVTLTSLRTHQVSQTAPSWQHCDSALLHVLSWAYRCKGRSMLHLQLTVCTVQLCSSADRA